MFEKQQKEREREREKMDKMGEGKLGRGLLAGTIRHVGFGGFTAYCRYK